MVQLIDISTYPGPNRVKERNLTLETEYFWSGLLSLDVWNEKWKTRHIDRKLDLNAQSLIRQLTGAFSEYLANNR